MKLILIYSALSMILFSCGTKEKRPDLSGSKSRPSVEEIAPTTSSHNRVEEVVDIDSLQSALSLKPGLQQLGYREKRFDTCDVGSGYSSVNNCRKKTFVLIQFQLLCRNSEGTVSEVITPADLQPIANQPIRWTLKGSNGETYTNEGGFGQIAMVSADSQRLQRLRLAVGNDFLAVRAGEIQQLIAPGNWCR